MSSPITAVDVFPIQAAPHVHHPNADSNVEFNGLAAHEKGAEVKVRNPTFAAACQMMQLHN
jgi:hypothetical protein